MPQDPLNLVCVEPHFPGRLGAVADWLVRKRGYRCTFFCHQAGPKTFWPESTGRGMEVIAFKVGGAGQEGTVSWRRSLERSLCYSFGAWEVIHHRRPRPVDVVLGRSDGLGSSLFAPVYAPRTPGRSTLRLLFSVAKIRSRRGDEPRNSAAYYHWRRSANAIDLLDLENGVLPWAPTAWQRELYPAPNIATTSSFSTTASIRDGSYLVPRDLGRSPNERSPTGQRWSLSSRNASIDFAASTGS